MAASMRSLPTPYRDICKEVQHRIAHKNEKLELAKIQKERVLVIAMFSYHREKNVQPLKCNTAGNVLTAMETCH